MPSRRLAGGFSQFGSMPTLEDSPLTTRPTRRMIDWRRTQRRFATRRKRDRWTLIAAVIGIVLAGCERKPAADVRGTNDEVPRGAPIEARAITNGFVSNAAPSFVPADFSKPDLVEGDVIQLSWDKLSGFKFDVYEVYSETNSGRALLKSDDTIPPQILAYDGKSVTVSGYILPLRVQRGLTKEFLLLRDQGTCCFGQRAQINHFIRVKLGAGVKAETGIPYQVSGKLRVGEIMIQGYLTGIYRLDASEVREAVGW